MATSTTFTTLQQDMRRYLERGDTLASDATVYEQLPRLINLAERRITAEIKLQGFITPVTSTMTPGTSVYAKPDRWRQTVSINFGAGDDHADRTDLLARSYEYCRTYWPNESLTGQPQFYADYDYNHWLVVPTPDYAYPFEALSYTLPQLLDDTVQSNWLTEYAPQALLYAALLEATPFIKADDRIGIWQGMYDRAIQALNGEDLGKIIDRAAERRGA